MILSTFCTFPLFYQYSLCWCDSHVPSSLQRLSAQRADALGVQVRVDLASVQMITCTFNNCPIAIGHSWRHFACYLWFSLKHHCHKYLISSASSDLIASAHKISFTIEEWTSILDIVFFQCPSIYNWNASIHKPSSGVWLCKDSLDAQMISSTLFSWGETCMLPNVFRIYHWISAVPLHREHSHQVQRQSLKSRSTFTSFQMSPRNTKKINHYFTG